MPTTDTTEARIVLRSRLPEVERTLTDISGLLRSAGCRRLYKDLLFVRARFRRLKRVMDERTAMEDRCSHCGARYCYCCEECSFHVLDHDVSCSHHEDNL